MADPNFFSSLIDVYLAQCASDGVLPDPPGLILALGLTSKQEYEDQKRDPEVARVLREAELRMASQWYQLLTKKDAKVNVLGITYALKTMGFHDHFKAQESNRDTLIVQVGEGHQRL